MAVHGFSRTGAAAAIAAGLFDMIAFGQAYMANPDLVERFRNGWPLNPPDPATFYTQGAEGYTDYPEYAETDLSKTVPVESIFGVGASGQVRSAASAR
jgi:2,4-dienoyl-CoA reductase-like NADH-dependent reductase (Old Yellow Enzyme family)